MFCLYKLLFPREKDIEPRYDQISLNEVRKENEFYQVLSPHKEDQGVWIHQDAWFHLCEFTREVSMIYRFKNRENGLYAFVLQGEVEIEGQHLSSRDGFGIWEVEAIHVKAQTGSKVLFMELPMTL